MDDGSWVSVDERSMDENKILNYNREIHTDKHTHIYIERGRVELGDDHVLFLF